MKQFTSSVEYTQFPCDLSVARFEQYSRNYFQLAHLIYYSLLFVYWKSDTAPAMRTVLALIAGVIASAWSAPPIYWLLQDFGAFPFLQVASFHRVWSRVSMVCTMGALLISLRISDFKQLALQNNRHQLRDISWGLFSAAMPMALLMVAYIQFNICQVQGDIALLSFLTVIVRAVGIAIFEEILFRGLLYRVSCKRMGAPVSAFWTSGIFAILHFINASGATHPVDIWSGWREWGCLFNSIPPWPTFLFALVNLLIVGLLLCWIVEQTHSLALPVGLHIGWIVVIQTGNLFIKFQMATGHLPWAGPHVVSGTIPIGILAILALCFTAFLCWQYLKNTRDHVTGSL